MSNYSKGVPLEIYKKVLLHLDPEDLKILCLTDKYTQSICKDNYFYYQYINFNYDPYEYGYASWEYNKDILNKLSSDRIVVSVLFFRARKQYNISIHKNDTLADIINRIIRICNIFNEGNIEVIIINGKETMGIIYDNEYIGLIFFQ